MRLLYEHQTTILQTVITIIRVFNIMQAARTNTDIITLPPSLINACNKEVGKDLDEFSLETVKMFYNDAKKSGFSL